LLLTWFAVGGCSGDFSGEKRLNAALLTSSFCFCGAELFFTSDLFSSFVSGVWFFFFRSYSGLDSFGEAGFFSCNGVVCLETT
jgi:hypothetical protein